MCQYWEALRFSRYLMSSLRPTRWEMKCVIMFAGHDRVRTCDQPSGKLDVASLSEESPQNTDVFIVCESHDDWSELQD